MMSATRRSIGMSESITEAAVRGAWQLSPRFLQGPAPGCGRRKGRGHLSRGFVAWRRKVLQRAPHDQAGAARPARVIDVRHLEAQLAVELDGSFVIRAGDRLQRRGAALSRRRVEYLIQLPRQPAAASIVAHGNEVDVAVTGGCDEPEQVAGDLAVAPPRHECSVTELVDEHGVVEVPRQGVLAPETLIVTEDLAQVTGTGTADGDLAHSGILARHSCPPRFRREDPPAPPSAAAARPAEDHFSAQIQELLRRISHCP